MSKNIKMLYIKMNDTIPEIKNFTIFSGQTHNSRVCIWLTSLENSLTIYKLLKNDFGPSFSLPRINPIEINLDVSKNLAIMCSFFFF